MPLPDFHVSEPFTLGIELEMQVVNPPGYDLSQDSSMLIDTVKNQITAGEVKHDITESMLELATDVCRDINQAAGQFSAMQKVVLQAAADHHLEICGGGTHPFQKWQRQEVCDNERYQRTLENFGYLIQQATVFGQHVHVGCASGDDAIYLLHGLSRFVPHFIALSAASPYMQGTDTRVAKSAADNYVFNERKMLDASHVVVFCAKTAMDDAWLKLVVDQEDADGRFATPEAKAANDKGRKFFADMHRKDLHDDAEWMAKQVYLNVGNFLLGVAALGLDAVPIEGFDAAILDEEFGLKEKGYTSLVVVPVGHHSVEDFNATLPKSRLPQNITLTEV